MTPLLTTEHLTKKYGHRLAVNDLQMEVYEGDIYGFLGLNGAGKTTTIRMALNLIRPSRGRAFLFGRDVRKNFIEVIRQVGSMVEIPTFYTYLSAYTNLEIQALAGGGIPRKRIHDLLERVGLGPRQHDRVRTYSQGMRQRLGIAQALLAQPRLVILDEPTNGLDPEGIHDIRGLIQSLNKNEGITFVISSHLLHEIEITATRVGIIREGKLIMQDKLATLLSQTASAVRVKAAPAEKALGIAQKLPWVKRAEPLPDGTLRVTLDPADSGRLNRELVQNGVEVGEISPEKLTLEEFFLRKP